MTKIYTLSNYFIVEIPGKPEPLQDGKSKVSITMLDAATNKFLIESPNIGSHELLLADLVDQSGTHYDEGTWRTFYTANSNFNPAPGGSGVVSVTGTGVNNSDPNNPVVDRVVGEGRVKINGSGGSQPTFSLVANVETVVDFGVLGLDFSSSPTNEWPQNVLVPSDSDIWRPISKSLIENTIPGQTHVWRVIFDYSGKNLNQLVGLDVILKNNLSGFIVQGTMTLPAGRTADSNQQQLLITIADGSSLPAPFGSGVGYQLLFRANRSLNIVVQSITRISQFHNLRS